MTTPSNAAPAPARSYLPSAKVAAGAVVLTAGGAIADYFADVDWRELLVAVLALLVQYLFPELNPAASALKRAGR